MAYWIKDKFRESSLFEICNVLQKNNTCVNLFKFMFTIKQIFEKNRIE